MDVLAPPSCFVGTLDPRIAQLLKNTVFSFNWMEIGRWALIIILALTAYSMIVIKLWKWFMDRGDSRTSYEKWMERKHEDEQEMKSIEEYHRKKAEKRKKKGK